ncbi:hypothetical protein LPB03_07050 [Polaribacter vadi]|uniref:Carrier domain-containing protein n=1 Tax=Polaribacter vadi TaxID=1774273 RepID=A0A1B8TYV4_9FLAO|nr:acyl carrier protein [Polaribacter vadi]AOW17236.1 hypothetical protein LPB03_07050 [Polaribacter vadi]OBY64837.1 hypothetical protein LPB3_05440 [Polaribacter vadi]
MKKKEFLERFQEELEIEETEIKFKTVIKNLDEWDSMGAMILISFVTNEFNVTLNAEDINSLTTIQSLIERIGLEKFN